MSICKVKKIKLLHELAKTEQTPRYRDRLRALIAVGEGQDPEDVAKIFDTHSHTIKYRWLKSWNQGGYASLIDKPKSGRPPSLNAKQKKALRQYVLNQKGRIVCKHISKFIMDRWNIDCDEETVRKILISMKLSWQKPDKENHKANKLHREIFLKSTQRCEERSWI